MDSLFEVANRLIALREVLQQDQKTFAESLGIEKNTYNAYERAKRPLTIETAKKIRKKYGISVDYLLFGDLGQPNYQFLLTVEAKLQPPVVEKSTPVRKRHLATR